MLSRILVEKTSAALWSLGAMWLLGVLIVVGNAGVEVVAYAGGGAAAGAIAGLLVLGFTGVFNPFCQDRCMVGISIFFVTAGVLIALCYVVAAAMGKVAATGELAAAVGMPVGLAAVAWGFGNRAAKRAIGRKRTHAA